HTRRRPAPTGGTGTDRSASVRTAGLEQAAAGEGRYREGESTMRALPPDLNHILREFASRRLRMDASSLTVHELARLEGTDRLVGRLQEYQEPACAADSDPQALAATQNARAVISQW